MSRDPQVQIVMDVIGHYACEDCWYSCPLSADGCCDDAYASDECNCGLDSSARQNAL